MDTTLEQAVCGGDLQKVKDLVSKGINIRQNDDKALRLSAEKGHYNIVKYLVEQGGANPQAFYNGALRAAAYHHRYAMVKYLIEKGANIQDAINHSTYDITKNVLKKFIKKKEMYKGPINDQTETSCAICLTEINNIEQEIVQCSTCKKCIHNECDSKWKSVNNSCVNNSCVNNSCVNNSCVNNSCVNNSCVNNSCVNNSCVNNSCVNNSCVNNSCVNNSCVYCRN
jgi:hypothetical protein